jgi:hypothetical protein
MFQSHGKLKAVKVMSILLLKKNMGIVALALGLSLGHNVNISVI